MISVASTSKTSARDTRSWDTASNSFIPGFYRATVAFSESYSNLTPNQYQQVYIVITGATYRIQYVCQYWSHWYRKEYFLSWILLLSCHSCNNWTMNSFETLPGILGYWCYSIFSQSAKEVHHKFNRIHLDVLVPQYVKCKCSNNWQKNLPAINIQEYMLTYTSQSWTKWFSNWIFAHNAANKTICENIWTSIWQQKTISSISPCVVNWRYFASVILVSVLTLIPDSLFPAESLLFTDPLPCLSW